jgi:hypothetical protein
MLPVYSETAGADKSVINECSQSIKLIRTV